MKRLLAICVCFFMCVGLCSCDSSQTRSVSSYNWSLEFITDLDGNMLFSGSVHDDIPVLDLTLSFEEKSFILTDNTHKQEWTGTYSLEKIDNSSSKLGLTFENLEETTTTTTTATTTGTDTIDSASQASPETSASSNTQTSLETPAPTLSDPDAVPLTPSGEEKVWVTKYGLKAFLPLAKNFPYSHYDDFGVSRSYGYRRRHLGHDMMGQTGTPVIAVESGRVEALGWNQYGGWRIGIRSFDGKRYYYYAHLRKDYPYQSNLKEGSLVTAGDVIGYLGHTGYSSTENTNNIAEPHLHFGLQLIFDESQKEGNNEIWIDCYELIRFLAINRSETVKKDGTKEWTRVYEMKDSSLEQFSTNDKNSRKR